MIKLSIDPTDKKEEFLKSLRNLTDNELLQKIVESQHYQMELINRNRRNTGIVVWFITISIALTIALIPFSLLPFIL